MSLDHMAYHYRSLSRPGIFSYWRAEIVQALYDIGWVAAHLHLTRWAYVIWRLEQRLDARWHFGFDYFYPLPEDNEDKDIVSHLFGQ